VYIIAFKVLNMTVIAIIPARGGSKRIERKNIKPFAGKPMIAHAIETAKKSQLFDHVIVSTDDREIRSIANSYGALTPFERPASLSDDHTGTDEVIRHALSMIEPELKPHLICALYPCTPLLPQARLIEGYEALADLEMRYSFSVLEYPHPLKRALRRAQKGVIMINPDMLEKRTQDLETHYHDAGQFYWGRTKAWLGEEPIFSPLSVPIVCTRVEAVDIDTEADWALAESLFALTKNA
jgi:pseudaminic acid cytidylyltransferase